MLPVLSLLHLGRRSRGVERFRREPFGQSKIQDLDLASFVQADVGRLDITVHDPAGMSGVQRVGHLGGQIDDLRDFEPSFFQDRIQRPAFDEFHGDKRQPVVRLAHVVHNADVRMIERRGGPGFLEESLPSLGVRGQFRRQELDRRLAFQPGVLGQKDLSHAAGTELGRDAIVADRLADHLSSLPRSGMVENQS